MKDKNSVASNSNSPRAPTSARAPPPPSWLTPSPATHTATRVKSNPQSQNKTTTTTAPPSTTPQTTAKARARRKTAGWETRRVGVSMAKSMEGRRKSIWIGPILRWIRMPGGSDWLIVGRCDKCQFFKFRFIFFFISAWSYFCLSLPYGFLWILRDCTL